ncbi:arginine decarboxylase 2 isoform X2 [Setaria viridis]|uniref:arginine decarboxylase 2 isoform X2 n=1 Tax=Setaria viridis TaxID=4556 RepID=UPI0014939F94|nr:arginine decarboxylase 2-like isoform X2 [Setaria viridis]
MHYYIIREQFFPIMTKNYGELYNVLGWGDPYFAVNAEGHLCARPHGRETMPGQEIDIHSVILKALETPTNGGKSKAQFPMILRFPDVLKNRLDSLHAAFKGAIDSLGYTSRYQGVFPIKVNQNKAVVQDLVAFGYDESYGLEAGSKPELLIAISCLTKAKPGAYLVCNGYKDADYIALALLARAMGLNTIIVLEMEEELDIVIDQYEKLKLKLGDKVDFEPVIGVRAKLLTKIPGHFGSTAGKHGKFGLLAETIYGVAKKLKEGGRLHWLKLLHFHVGSMIPTTDIVYNAASEAAGIYCELVNTWGAEMTTLDCGGGLGVDYDGTRSGSSDMSVAYGIEQYASSIVQAVRLKCAYQGVAHPVLCTESGRAMASHHSMIILEALSAIQEPQDEDTSEQLLSKIQDLSSKHPGRATAANGGGAFEGIYSHAAELKKHGIEMYKLGKKLSKRIVGDANPIYNYHMNLSVFSLVPDFWGIKQLFPMMPVSRLNEKPGLNGTLVDITCDSDGKIEKFISGGETLPLHPLDPEHGGYYVAALLSGAYQEALSCKHNLFSGPTLVRVKSNGEDGGFDIVSVDLGPTAEEVIATMRYNVEEDISNVIQELAKTKEVWQTVEPLMTKGLTTMPYLNEYEPPKTIT